MSTWSKQEGIEIDTGIFFPTVKDIVDLLPNPQTAEKKGKHPGMSTMDTEGY